LRTRLNMITCKIKVNFDKLDKELEGMDESKISRYIGLKMGIAQLFLEKAVEKSRREKKDVDEDIELK